MNQIARIREFRVPSRHPAFILCIEAAAMARDNARRWRRNGEPEAAREAFERAYDYIDMARRRRLWK